MSPRSRHAILCAVALMFTVQGCAFVPFLRRDRAGASATVAARHESPTARREESPAVGVSEPVGSIAEARVQMSREGDEIAWCLEMARRAIAADSLDEAESAWAEALRRRPHDAGVLTAWSAWMFRTGRSAPVVDRFERLRGEGVPLAPEVRAALAVHLDALDQVDDASRVWASLSPQEQQRLSGVGVFLALRGDRPDSAESPARERAARRPDGAVDQNNLGLVHLRLGAVDEARNAFDRAARLDPTLPGPCYNLAILERFYAFNDSAAASWFARYRTLASGDPDGLGSLLGAGDRGMAGKEEP